MAKCRNRQQTIKRLEERGNGESGTAEGNRTIIITIEETGTTWGRVKLTCVTDKREMLAFA